MGRGVLPGSLGVVLMRDVVRLLLQELSVFFSTSKENVV